MTDSAIAPSLLRVFVYGTLKPGEYYYAHYCQGRVVDKIEAIAFGHLYSLSLGYPAMTLGDGATDGAASGMADGVADSIVHGVVLTFADLGMLNDLDELEGYSPKQPPEENEYQRVELEVWSGDRRSLGKAWTYVMRPEQIALLGGVRLADGHWTGTAIK